ncbi:MAG: hypothetical protein K0B11_16445 [Mariniphaga sp.]|nr:hypothetical protein [Mariniphaga sp.]
MNTTLTEQDYDRIGHATVMSAVKLLQKQKPDLQRKAATRNNTAVNWNLINNLPHNLEADEATGTDPEANTPAWHIIENLDHHMEVD